MGWRSLDRASRDVYKWFAELEATGVRIADGAADTKMLHEAQEFVDDPSLEEAADVFIALLGACETRGWSAADLAQAVVNKTAINRTRTWYKLPDGTHRHA